MIIETEQPKDYMMAIGLKIILLKGPKYIRHFLLFWGW